MLENNRKALSRESSQPSPSLPENGGSLGTEPGRKTAPVLLNLSAGMLENNRLKRPKSILDVFVSVFLHCLVLAAAIIIPLYFTNALDVHPLEATYLAAPPPPPPPPAPARVITTPRHFFANQGLYAPRVIPKQIAKVRDLPSSKQTDGALNGVIGGVPGGQAGGVLGGILGGTGTVAPPPPPKAAPKHGPYRVGGQVRPPKIIDEVQPAYPPLAREARVQGDVKIDSVIDAQGDVTNLKLVSGNPLLITAALDAVRQWKYQPTTLNGTPISVEMQVTVHFSLAS